jgi:hypothetical protein
VQTAGNAAGQAFTMYADQVSNTGDDDKAGAPKKLASAGGQK